MSIFSRMTDIVNSNINAILERPRTQKNGAAYCPRNGRGLVEVRSTQRGLLPTVKSCCGGLSGSALMRMSGSARQR